MKQCIHCDEYTENWIQICPKCSGEFQKRAIESREAEQKRTSGTLEARTSDLNEKKILGYYKGNKGA